MSQDEGRGLFTVDGVQLLQQLHCFNTVEGGSQSRGLLLLWRGPDAAVGGDEVECEDGSPFPVDGIVCPGGALPEHGIAVIAATRGKVGLAVGNLVGGVLQITLLVGGGIGMFVPIPLDRYVLFQIVVLAGSLWFMKRNIADDKKLDMFEGLMIILLQAYVFLLLLIGTGV